MDVFDNALLWITCPINPAMRQLLVKDLRIFRRDPVHWSQFLIFFGLLGLYFINVRRLQYGGPLDAWMTMVGFLNVAVVGLILSTPLAAAPPLKFEGARAKVYKQVGDVKLYAYVFVPEGHKPSDQRPAAVFFFGGGWNGGTPKQFEPHARYLASRGMVAVLADYRVKGRQGTTPFECVKDGKSAVRWVRAHAAQMGVDGP